jgi:hypothetical protein
MTDRSAQKRSCQSSNHHRPFAMSDDRSHDAANGSPGARPNRRPFVFLHYIGAPQGKRNQSKTYNDRNDFDFHGHPPSVLAHYSNNSNTKRNPEVNPKSPLQIQHKTPLDIPPPVW